MKISSIRRAATITVITGVVALGATACYGGYNSHVIVHYHHFLIHHQRSVAATKR